jgi:HSP20 family protein
MTTLQRNRVGQLFPGSLREFDSLMNQVLGGGRATTWHAPASIWEAESTFHVELDAPGVAKEDVDLTFDKGTLQIALERKLPEGDRTNWHNERGFGKVTRSVSLPDTVDPSTIAAELTSGVLHVTIGKRPESQPKKIEVKVN